MVLLLKLLLADAVLVPCLLVVFLPLMRRAPSLKG